MYSYIFDIGGVLIIYEYRKIVEALHEKTGCEISKIEELFKLERIYPVETGKISGHEFYNNYVVPIMPSLSYEEWIQNFVDNSYLNRPGMELLLELKNKGRDVYLLSNLADFHKIAMERTVPGLFDICKRNFLSYELGYHKPEAEIYKAVCEAIGAKPETCVFFDDMKENVEGAKKVGLIGIQFSNQEIASIRKRVEELDSF